MKSKIFRFFLITAIMSLQFSAYAKKIKYEVRGTHQFKTSKPRNFTLLWTEEGTVIEGSYLEEGDKVQPLKGMLNKTKRSFIITDFKNREYTVLFIDTLPIKGAQTATIPLSVTFMDPEFKPLGKQSLRVIYHGEP